MNEGNSSDRVTGWLLAGALFVHLLLLRDSSSMVLAAYLLLGVGALLRGQQIFAPPWLERGLFLLGVLAVFLMRRDLDSSLMIGKIGGVAGAVFLLRPVTPRRGLRVIFCVLAVLVALVLQRSPSIGALFIVADVVVLMVLAQQIYRPPEAVRSFWASLVRSLRVVVPVSIIVMLVFWLFPDYSLQPMAAITGFTGGSTLDPSRVGELSQSRRVALVARFAESQELPTASQLYWRGQVMEKNEGLRWLRDPTRNASPRSLETPPAAPGAPMWRYTQEVLSNRGGILPVLDRVLTVEATRGGQDIAVLELGGTVLSAVGAGSMRMEVTAAADPVSDPPEETIDGGALGVPLAIQKNEGLRKVVRRVILPDRSTAENLQFMARYFKESGFTYTMRPGRGLDLGKFLMTTRTGFCEHYAAAAANLFRLGGIPARVIVGFRGGDWNPWLRTLTVRDSNAHAWVEVWDKPSGRWLRFDPTNSVAPNLTEGMERELNSDEWPWYRLAGAFVSAFFSEIGDRIGRFFTLATESELWEALQPVFFTGLLLILAVWLARRLIHRHLQNSRDLAASLLRDLENRATRLGLQRHDGETPLAWLARLQHTADGPEKETLARFAVAYTMGVYSGSGLTPATVNELRSSARQLKGLWKNRRREAVKIAS